VIEGIVAKMIRRHPHVFGDEAARSAGAAKGFWDSIKAAEKAARAERQAADGDAEPASLLADVPLAMPALTRAVKLQARAAKVGFDWPSLTPVLDKLREELGELEAEIAAGDRAKARTEFGDLLFVVANVARHLEIDPEAALREANHKFSRRFAAVERKLALSSKTPADSDLAEMDALWDEVKAEEKAQEKG
jgi:MazG family protein